jgi:hypothetical protein
VDSWKTLIDVSISPTPTNKIGKTLGLTVRGDEAKAGWSFPTVRYSINRVIIHFEAKECLFPEEDWAFNDVTLTDLEIPNLTKRIAARTAAGQAQFQPRPQKEALRHHVRAPPRKQSPAVPAFLQNTGRFSLTEQQPILDGA